MAQRDLQMTSPTAMSVASTGPLRAASRVWSPSPGRWALTLVCKATYRLTPGESPLDAEQEEPNEDDNYWDDDPERSLQSPSDLAPLKERADVLLVGHAFAPGGAPARSIATRLVVGEIEKSIEATCDRALTREGEIREGPMVTRVSLRYERAAGGPGSSNPAGVRLDKRDAYGALLLPNLLGPGAVVTARGASIPPVGYGPVAPTWPSRQEKLGPHRGSWDHARWYERPLPEGLDLGFFNAAPADQQVSALSFREPIVLENLHPQHARLVTRLCGVRPAATVMREGQRPELAAMIADTLWIDATRGVCTLAWRGLIHLRDRFERGQIVVATEAPGSSGDERAAPRDHDSAETRPLRPDWSRSKPVMPFVTTAPEPARPAPRELPLEECAAIAAKTARRKADAAAIFEEHRVKADEYAAANDAWLAAIRKEAARGKTALLDAYDAAYVAELEKERGPILIDEYALLVVANERGETDGALAELTLPRGAIMRIERVWLAKITGDPALASTLRKAIEQKRSD